MNKILFFDKTNSGHHYIYNKEAMKTLIEKKGIEVHYYSKFNDDLQIDQLEQLNVVNRNFRTEGSRGLPLIIELLYLRMYLKKNKINKLHLFYLDSDLIYAPVFWVFFKDIDITATMHWYPNKKIKEKLLKNLIESSVIKKIVVHGNYTKQKVENLVKRKNSVFSITYPYLHSKKAEASTLKRVQHKLENKEKPIFLAFGGLRRDKGIDILLEALKKVKLPFTLIIAGGESDFKKDEIIKIVEANKISHKVILDIQFIDEEALDAYFTIADVVVLPYRKYFSGQSGPLTEGANRSKVILGPSSGEVGYTIEKYNLGITFISENENDLQEKIEFLISNINNVKNQTFEGAENYQKEIDIKNFSYSYQKFFLNSQW
ncbi:glycosyltransferase family 4 protein [Domibacillus enclensis]|uniref:Glycosyltransferase involved in cell wall bisynthesis n=1 Tax=Domibacillus enclensis TaxID=1017273 RepID=A0A1N6RP82_9BACI|nr:glycosyltransferase family 4 protein [Domibacillus enclensis]OXS79113.1 hypothetical protein B1B05_04865 [Domibacillus enclensis]SIQ30698.1 Glycosyltransferase involved in cell wall bisynthesis [Domibacillus enclensis]